MALKGPRKRGQWSSQSDHVINKHPLVSPSLQALALLKTLDLEIALTWKGSPKNDWSYISDVSWQSEEMELKWESIPDNMPFFAHLSLRTETQNPEQYGIKGRSSDFQSGMCTHFTAILKSSHAVCLLRPHFSRRQSFQDGWPRKAHNSDSFWETPPV